MAVIFVYSQDKSIRLIQPDENRLSISKMFFFSFLRIIMSSVILLFAFLQSLTSGFACLISFIIARWLTLLFLLKKSRRGI